MNASFGSYSPMHYMARPGEGLEKFGQQLGGFVSNIPGLVRQGQQWGDEMNKRNANENMKALIYRRVSRLLEGTGITVSPPDQFKGASHEEYAAYAVAPAIAEAARNYGADILMSRGAVISKEEDAKDGFSEPGKLEQNDENKTTFVKNVPSELGTPSTPMAAVAQLSPEQASNIQSPTADWEARMDKVNKEGATSYRLNALGKIPEQRYFPPDTEMFKRTKDAGVRQIPYFMDTVEQTHQQNIANNAQSLLPAAGDMSSQELWALRELNKNPSKPPAWMTQSDEAAMAAHQPPPQTSTWPTDWGIPSVPSVPEDNWTPPEEETSVAPVDDSNIFEREADMFSQPTAVTSPEQAPPKQRPPASTLNPMAVRASSYSDIANNAVQGQSNPMLYRQMMAENVGGSHVNDYISALDAEEAMRREAAGQDLKRRQTVDDAVQKNDWEVKAAAVKDERERHAAAGDAIVKSFIEGHRQYDRDTGKELTMVNLPDAIKRPDSYLSKYENRPRISFSTSSSNTEKRPPDYIEKWRGAINDAKGIQKDIIALNSAVDKTQRSLKLDEEEQAIIDKYAPTGSVAEALKAAQRLAGAFNRNIFSISNEMAKNNPSQAESYASSVYDYAREIVEENVYNTMKETRNQSRAYGQRRMNYTFDSYNIPEDIRVKLQEDFDKRYPPQGKTGQQKQSDSVIITKAQMDALVANDKFSTDDIVKGLEAKGIDPAQIKEIIKRRNGR